VPVVDGFTVACPQIPTTLPTVDELIGVDGMTAMDAAERVLALTAREPVTDHVFTLHAELEGMRLMPAFERMLEGWKAQGYALVSLRELRAALDTKTLPRHRVYMAPVEGRSGLLACQGAKV